MYTIQCNGGGVASMLNHLMLVLYTSIVSNVIFFSGRILATTKSSIDAWQSYAHWIFFSIISLLLSILKEWVVFNVFQTHTTSKFLHIMDSILLFIQKLSSRLMADVWRRNVLQRKTHWDGGCVWRLSCFECIYAMWL